VLQAIVFHWPSVTPADREPFLKRLFGDRVLGPHLARVEGKLELANKDLVPFALLGRPGLNAEGATFETRVDSHLIGVLFFDLLHGAAQGACPILLWDMRRFGKVVANVAALKLRLAAVGEISHVVMLMQQRTFVRTVEGQQRFWQIEVAGRRVKMQRGLMKAECQKDWSTNEIKEADFPSSADAKTRADDLVRKYLGEGYVEQPRLDP
jgi:predicted DNA-binding WGR domain protein